MPLAENFSLQQTRRFDKSRASRTIPFDENNAENTLV
jgi:hypothetical protein